LPWFYKELKTLRNLIKLVIKSWKDPSVVKIAKRVDGKITAKYLLWKKTREKEH